MKILFLLTIFIVSLGASANDGEKLVAKCGFPVSDGVTIEPGAPFVYVFKNGSVVTVVNSIANAQDKINERVTPLRGQLMGVVAKDVPGLGWDQPDLTQTGYVQENYIGIDVLNPIYVEELVVVAGTASYTHHAYPTCFIWK